MASRLPAPANDDRLARVEELTWAAAWGFLGGCLFTVAGAWVWSWFL